MMLTDDDELDELLWSYRNVGRRRGGEWYEHVRLGWNLRMTEFQAAVLIGQLQRMPEQQAHRTAAAAYLDSELSRDPGRGAGPGARWRHRAQLVHVPLALAGCRATAASPSRRSPRRSRPRASRSSPATCRSTATRPSSTRSRRLGGREPGRLSQRRARGRGRGHGVQPADPDGQTRGPRRRRGGRGEGGSSAGVTETARPVTVRARRLRRDLDAAPRGDRGASTERASAASRARRPIGRAQPASAGACRGRRTSTSSWLATDIDAVSILTPSGLHPGQALAALRRGQARPRREADRPVRPGCAKRSIAEARARDLTPGDRLASGGSSRPMRRPPRRGGGRRPGHDRADPRGGHLPPAAVVLRQRGVAGDGRARRRRPDEPGDPHDRPRPLDRRAGGFRGRTRRDPDPSDGGRGRRRPSRVRFADGALGEIVATTSAAGESRLGAAGRSGTVARSGISGGEVVEWDVPDRPRPAADAAADHVPVRPARPPALRRRRPARPGGRPRAATSASTATSSRPSASSRPPFVTGEDGRDAVEIIVAAYESSRTGQAVVLERVPA